jgi:hypothetical protein
MANPEHLEILNLGVEAWNRWRRECPDVEPNLSGENLYRTNGGRADFSGANFIGAKLIRANFGGALSGAKLYGADLRGANLYGANLCDTGLTGANLTGANLFNADLTLASLHVAVLIGAKLYGADLGNAYLSGADFTGVKLGYTKFRDNDLSEVKGLETGIHSSPSSIDISTLYKSAGKLPKAFLRGCGVPDDFIAFIPSHFGVQQAIQFYSCFISYSTRDEEFARRLYSRMRDEKLRVWFAPEEMKGGQKLYEQIERAIQLHDRLLLVLSESSMQSEWVMTEILGARETEVKEGRRKLFPISIVEFEKIKAWRRFDADTGKDLAKEVREYFIPDFSNWKEHDAFEKAFERLLRDLRAEEARA